MTRNFLTNEDIEDYLAKNFTEDSRLEDYMIGEDRELNVGQYKQILKTFAGLKRGQKAESYKDYFDILFTMGDYWDNVAQGDYDHVKYMQYLFENKDVPEELLKLIPRIEY